MRKASFRYTILLLEDKISTFTNSLYFFYFSGRLLGGMNFEFDSNSNFFWPDYKPVARS